MSAAAVWMGFPDPDQCPEHIREAIDDYVVNHRAKGGFVMAVLENNLREAIGRADDGNLRAIPHIVAYCYNRIPASCWGSKDAVAAWLQQGRDVAERGEDFDRIVGR